MRESAKTRRARMAMEAAPFVVQAPVSVVEFTGVSISTHAQTATDFHVVDARGRTIHRIVQRTGDGDTPRRERADWYAAELNALLA